MADNNLHLKKSFWARAATMSAAAIYIAVAISSIFIQDNNIEGCIRNGVFKDAEAMNWEQASSVRLKGGDEATAKIYAANAIVIRSTIPMPDDWRVTDDNLRTRGSDPSFRRQGCKDAYKPLVPFI